MANIIKEQEDACSARREKMIRLQKRLNQCFSSIAFGYDYLVDECMFTVTPRNRITPVLAEVLVDLDRKGNLTGIVTIACKTHSRNGMSHEDDHDFSGIKCNGQWYIVHEFAVPTDVEGTATKVIREEFASTYACAQA